MAIISVTILVNLIILPLTIKQTRATVAMQKMQPELKKIQEKHSKDKQKLQQETMKLYKESGINPLGCALPLIIQLPIWIALYQSIMQALPTTPERLIGLSDRLYNWPLAQGGVPPDGNFLGLDLAQPNFIMVLLVMASMWFTQKISMSPSPDPRQQQMQQMMQWMMPLFIGFIFLTFPSGLALYIIIMNMIRMIVQYFLTGKWRKMESVLRQRLPILVPAGQGATGGTIERSGDWSPSEQKTTAEVKPGAEKAKTALEKGKGTKHGSSRSKRKKRRRSR